MKAIGGFFEIELKSGNTVFHDDAIQLSTGRACLNYLLQVFNPSKVYLPYYCCDALFEPLEINNIEYQFYSVDSQLEIINHPKLKSTEFIIYCNFFGVKSKYTEKLINIYKNQLIIDNSHSFFHKGYKSNASFTTARKYFGVPDGAFLYIQKNERIKSEIIRNTEISINHNVSSLLGLHDLAYLEFSEYEKSLDSKIQKISLLSEKLLSNVDFQNVRATRNRNFNFFKEEFKKINTIIISDTETDCFCYPLLLSKPINIKEFHDELIFLPSYWKDTLQRDGNKRYEFECKISTELLALPIDHRYSIDELKRVSSTIRKFIK